MHDCGQCNLDKEVTKKEDEFLGTVNVKHLYLKIRTPEKSFLTPSLSN